MTRISGQFAGVVLGIVVALCARVTTAEAHDAALQDLPQISCVGLLSGRVVSWRGLPYNSVQPDLQEQSRTNPWITVWYAPDGGDYMRLPQTYDLSPRDDFSFRFSFQLPGPLPHAVSVKVVPEAPWADGAAPGPAMLSGPVTMPPPCPPTAARPHRAISLLQGQLSGYALPVLTTAAAIAAVGGAVYAVLAARGSRRAGLDGADLSAANLHDARFEKASLRGARFEKADLSGAHFESADLRGAHFEEAILAGTHLQGADLAGAQGLTRAQLARVLLDRQARLPSYVLEHSSGA
jgi:hypothetical protein